MDRLFAVESEVTQAGITVTYGAEEPDGEWARFRIELERNHPETLLHDELIRAVVSTCIREKSRRVHFKCVDVQPRAIVITARILHKIADPS